MSKSISRLLIVSAWALILLVSDLPDILLNEFAGIIPEWLFGIKVGVIAMFLGLCIIWKRLRPLWQYALILLGFYLALSVSIWFGKAFLHARVEWAGKINDSIEQYGPSDADPTAASRLEKVVWQGNEIRVPPLDLSLEVSKRRGLTDRVEKIKRYLAHQA